MQWNYENLGRAAHEVYQRGTGGVLAWEQLSRQTQLVWIEVARTVMDIQARAVLA